MLWNAVVRGSRPPTPRPAAAARGMPPAEIAAARREVAVAGLEIVGGGMITFEADTDEGVQKYFDYARAAGMPVMVSTCSPAVLLRVEKFAKRYDIKVAIHNHGPEDT